MKGLALVPAIAVCVAAATPAMAQSLVGAATTTVFDCGTLNTASCTSSVTRAGATLIAAGLGSTANVSTAAAIATTTAVGDQLDGLVGEAARVVEDLTSITAVIRADASKGIVRYSIRVPATNSEYRGSVNALRIIECPGCVSGHENGFEPGPGGDSYAKFNYNNTANLRWSGDANKKVDGLARYNLYTAAEKPDPYREFYATSQVASATPINGRTIKGIITTIEPNAHLQLVASSPLGVNEYGSSGSLSLNATLSGEISRDNSGSAGGSFGIARTWNYAVGHVGGADTSKMAHYAQWRARGNGDKFAKSAEGVETWTSPNKTNVVWYISAVATTRK